MADNQKVAVDSSRAAVAHTDNMVLKREGTVAGTPDLTMEVVAVHRWEVIDTGAAGMNN